MSNQVFPALPGLAWGISRKPLWPTTRKTAVSGRSYRGSHATAPRWRYKLPFEFLRSGSQQELQTLVAFFNSHQGGADSWLYLDPSDNTVGAQQFGVGDGTATAFQLVRSLGGYVEPVYEPAAGAALRLNAGDWRGAELQYPTPRTNYIGKSQSLDSSPWGNLATTTWTGLATAPDGTWTASGMAETTATAYHATFQYASAATAAGQKFTVSVYLKASGRHLVTLQTDASACSGAANFDLANLTCAVAFGGASAPAIVDVGAGWRRCTVTWTSSGAGALGVKVILGNATFGNSYAGDGSSGVLIWGAQMEPGTAATPYMPNSGTSALTVPAAYTLGANGLITYSTAPPAGAVLTWSGQYYWRCAFDADELDINQFAQGFWELKSLEFTTLKL